MFLPRMSIIIIMLISFKTCRTDTVMKASQPIWLRSICCYDRTDSKQHLLIHIHVLNFLGKYTTLSTVENEGP